MPSYTVEAFRWSGTGYNAQYNTSYTATFTDDDGASQGSGDGDEQVQIDGGAVNGTLGSPYKIAISFTDTNGDSHVEDFNFFYTSDGGWHFIAEPGSEFTVGATLGSYQSHTVGWDYDEVVCFVQGTLIQTPNGPKPVQQLKAGDFVTCHDGTAKPLRVVLSRRFRRNQLEQNEKLRPVRITAGALGLGLPERDLLVSRQHRMLIKSRISERLFGQEESLVAAVKLTELPGIYIETTPRPISYFHIGFDTHDIVYAEGAPAESLLHGAEEFDRLIPDAQQELAWLLPGCVPENDIVAHQDIPSLDLQKTIVAKHRVKGKTIRN